MSNNVGGFTREDPWRIFRIMAEFVDSFETLSQVGPAVTIFGSARLPPSDRRLAFPIADTEDDWEREKSRIRSLPDGARTVIESAQPCFGGNPVLSVLGRLNNQDKHRLPVAAAGQT
jgi:hypothetical protein